jgi:hypothetical protein
VHPQRTNNRWSVTSGVTVTRFTHVARDSQGRGVKGQQGAKRDCSHTGCGFALGVGPWPMGHCRSTVNHHVQGSNEMDTNLTLMRLNLLCISYN